MTTFAGVKTYSEEEVGNDAGRWLIHGPQGSGKTTLAATIAECGKTLLIDLTGERGIRSIKGMPFSENITIIRPDSVTALDDIFWELAKGKHEYEAVIIDSLTAVQKMTMRFLLGHDETAVKEIKQGTAPAQIQTWGQALDIMTDLATFWFGLADSHQPKPMHVIMTAQTKVKEDDFGNAVRTPDVQPGALSIILAVPDYVLYCEVEENTDAIDSDDEPAMKHIVRFGADPSYRTKARLPFNLRGKIPAILGRKNSTNLTQLSRVLGIGGIPKAAPKKKKQPIENKEK